jgi:hypothetical protein
MIASAHDFRSSDYEIGTHVAWCSWSVGEVFGLPYASHSQICQSEVPFFVENEVLWFDVSVEDSVVMEKLQCEDNAGCEEL